MLIFLSILMMTPPENVKKVYSEVSVDGVGYKVRHRGNQVSVVRRGGAFHGNDAVSFQRARMAAEFASGCVATETYVSRITLNVILDCSRKPAETAGVKIEFIKEPPV